MRVVVEREEGLIFERLDIVKRHMSFQVSIMLDRTDWHNRDLFYWQNLREMVELSELQSYIHDIADSFSAHMAALSDWVEEVSMWSELWKKGPDGESRSKELRRELLSLSLFQDAVLTAQTHVARFTSQAD